MAMVCSSALADTYSFTFDKNNKFSGPGTLLLNNVAWTLKTDAGHFMFEGGDNSRGLQIGSKSTPASYIELSTSSFLGTITSVKVNTSGAKNINATIDVTVGGAAFGEQQNLTQSTATDFEFKGSASGELKLNYKNQSKIAIYIKSIEVTYEGSIASKKAPELAFSETYFNVEQGAEFTSPTFTKATTAPVTFSSDNEFVASVNTEGKISLGGEVGTAKITAKSEENDEYLAGEATCTVTVFTYNTYKKATAVTSGKEYLLVVQKDNKTYYAVPLGKSSDYGYLDVYSVDGLTETVKVKSTYDDDFLFTAVDGGYTIMQPDGRYLYMDDSHNSFQIGEEPKSGNVWTVEPEDDGTFTITCNETKKYVQYTSYNTFGSYSDEQGLKPYLYEKDETATSIDNVTIVDKEFDENAPVYNLSGQRVDKSAKGILIQNGKKFIRR